jgi:hypothetical protein
MIAGSRLAIYRGASHGLVFTHQERLNLDIIDFAGLKNRELQAVEQSI